MRNKFCVVSSISMFCSLPIGYITSTYTGAYLSCLQPSKNTIQESAGATANTMHLFDYHGPTLLAIRPQGDEDSIDVIRLQCDEDTTDAIRLQCDEDTTDAIRLQCNEDTIYAIQMQCDEDTTEALRLQCDEDTTNAIRLQCDEDTTDVI